MTDPQSIVNEQAEDEGLWFIAATAPEAYLQQELRRLHAAIEAEAARPAPLDDLPFIEHGYTCGECGWGRVDQPRSLVDYVAHVNAEHPVLEDSAQPAPLDEERLAAVVDLHWMDWNAEAQTAVCSCGGWQFDAERDIVPGEHFAPFSRHVAAAIARAYREDTDE